MKPYRVYIAEFDGKDECRLRIGNGKLNHRAMLSPVLFEKFRCRPDTFIMGRLRASETMKRHGEAVVVLDAISECYWDMTRKIQRLSLLEQCRLAALLRALKKDYPGFRVLSLEGGKERRVSGLSDKEFDAIVAGKVPEDCRWLT